MPRYYTQEGLQIKRLQISRQEEKVRLTGSEVGEAAGPSCDWHDNFGYEDAKRRLEMESQILQGLTSELYDVQLITPLEQSSQIKIGVTATIKVDGNPREVTVGGYGEFDADRGLISYNSPIGRAIMGLQKEQETFATIGGKQVLISIEQICPPSHRYNNLIHDLMQQEMQKDH